MTKVQRGHSPIAPQTPSPKRRAEAPPLKKTVASERKRQNKFDESSSYESEPEDQRPRQTSLPPSPLPRRDKFDSDSGDDRPSPRTNLSKPKAKPGRRPLVSDDDDSFDEPRRIKSRRDRVIETPDQARYRYEDGLGRGPSPLAKSGKRGKIRPITSLDLNAETDDIPILDKKTSPRRSAASDEADSTSRRASRDAIDPNPVDWAFPLRFVPRPTDIDQIVSDLNEKYSIVRLLTYVKNS